MIFRGDALDLLRRYMRHVVNEEGVSYVGTAMTEDLQRLFSAEEIEVLRALSRETNAGDDMPADKGDQS